MGGCCEGSGGFPVVGERGGVNYEGGGRGRHEGVRGKRMNCVMKGFPA